MMVSPIIIISCKYIHQSWTANRGFSPIVLVPSLVKHAMVPNFFANEYKITIVIVKVLVYEFNIMPIISKYTVINHYVYTFKIIYFYSYYNTSNKLFKVDLHPKCCNHGSKTTNVLYKFSA